MRGDIFDEWLRSLNKEMRRKNKKILLLLDNAGVHGKEHDSLSNVTVKYLPPNTTTHLQPLDAGIIASFKAHYRKLFLFHLIDQYDGKIPESKLSLKDAVSFLIDAWSVSANTIENCWQHTGILEEGQVVAQPFAVEQELQQDVQVLIEQLDVESQLRLSARDYIDVDRFEPAFDYCTEEEIVDLINKRYNGELDEDLESDEEPPPPLSAQKGKAALEVALQYCKEEYSGKVSVDFFGTLRTLICDTALKVYEEKSKLDSFFSVIE